MTKIFHKQDILDAAQVLLSGGIIAFPTETVYGLGAIANQSAAVDRVFKVKGRPQDNPLIVHVSSKEQVAEFVKIHSEIQQLMDKFWPGPLTIVFPYDGDAFAPNIQAGQNTMSFRMPDQEDALKLIEAVGFPIVGPSANKSGKPSPTQLDHVLNDFNGEIEGVLASSTLATKIGIESTVIYPQKEKIYILRPGAITKSMLSEVATLPIEEMNAKEQLQQKTIYSPGVKYRHYSPNQPVFLAEDTPPYQLTKKKINQFDRPIGLLGDELFMSSLKDESNVKAYYSLGASGDIISATKYLYAGLRYLEQQPIDYIVAQSFEDKSELSKALMNRLTKASSYML